MEDTVRLKVVDEFRGSIGLEQIVMEVVKKVTFIQVRDVLGLQDYVKLGIYDITFCTRENCQRFYLELKRMKDGKKLAILEKIEIIPMYMEVKKAIVVHMYNPKVSDETVATFLGRYCEEVEFVGRMRNRFGYLNGKRKYMAKIKIEGSVLTGFRCLPTVFSIGGERGYCFYEGSLVYCRKCCDFGHTAAECKSEKIICRNCLEEGHTVKECKMRKKCDVCGCFGHFAKQCPAWKKESYAVKDMKSRSWSEVVSTPTAGAGVSGSTVTGGSAVASVIKLIQTKEAVQSVTKGKRVEEGEVLAGKTVLAGNAKAVVEGGVHAKTVEGHVEKGCKSAATDISVVAGSEVSKTDEVDVQGTDDKVPEDMENQMEEEVWQGPCLQDMIPSNHAIGEGESMDTEDLPLAQKFISSEETSASEDDGTISESKRPRVDESLAPSPDPLAMDFDRDSGPESPDVGCVLSRKVNIIQEFDGGS